MGLEFAEMILGEVEKIPKNAVAESEMKKVRLILTEM